MSDALDFTRQDTVLIVDDAPDNLTLMTGLLRGEYKTKVANSGARGLQVAAADQPDLVLLDVDMPGMDGYEVCRRLKENPETSAIPVIFLTAKTAVEDEQKGFDAGCVDYITKPISAPVVLARVKTHLLLKGARDFLKDQAAYLEAEVARRAGEAAAPKPERVKAVTALAKKLSEVLARTREIDVDPALVHALTQIESEFKALAGDLTDTGAA